MHDTDWNRLKAEIEDVVSLEPIEIELGGRWFTWHRVTNTDDLLQAALDSNSPPVEVDPFWAATWRAARGLDKFLQRLDCRDTRVLELGCGSGQAGTGAAARGAYVVMTDAVPLALRVAKLNAWPVLERIRFQQLRWTIDRVEEDPFPLIIGSDLVYDPNLFPLLNDCLRQHLAPGGRVLFSEPHRHTGDKFSKWIVDAGWHKLEHDIDMGDGSVPIRIFELTLK